MSTIFSTFFCHLTSLRSQCPAGLSSCPPWCPHRQERQEAVDLVAFSTATALPSGMTRLRPWEGVSKCGAHSCPVTAVTHKHRHDGSKQRTFVILQSGDRKSKFCLTGPKSRCLQGCGLGEYLFSCLLHLLETTCIPWLVAPFHRQSQQAASCHLSLTSAPSYWGP